MLMPMTRGLLIAAVTLSVSQAQAGGKNRLASIAWQSSFQAAFETAAAEKKPVFVAINMDQDSANDDMVRNTYHDSDVVRLSRKCVCLIASVTKHDEIPGPTGELVCSRFGSIRCADHIAVERAVRTTFLKGQVSIIAPQHILATPDRTPLEIREYLVSARQLGCMITDALDKVANPVKARRAEQARLLELVNEAAKNPTVAAPVISLANSLLDWSSEIALGVVKARAPTGVKLAIVQELASRGQKAEAVLLTLLEDPYARVREQVAIAFGSVGNDKTREVLTRRMGVERDVAVKKALATVLQTVESR